jgi:hypothetical protein
MYKKVCFLKIDSIYRQCSKLNTKSQNNNNTKIKFTLQTTSKTAQEANMQKMQIEQERYNYQDNLIKTYSLDIKKRKKMRQHHKKTSKKSTIVFIKDKSPQEISSNNQTSSFTSLQLNISRIPHVNKYLEYKFVRRMGIRDSEKHETLINEARNSIKESTSRSSVSTRKTLNFITSRHSQQSLKSA